MAKWTQIKVTHTCRLRLEVARKAIEQTAGTRGRSGLPPASYWAELGLSHLIEFLCACVCDAMERRCRRREARRGRFRRLLLDGDQPINDNGDTPPTDEGGEDTRRGDPPPAVP